MGIQWEGQPKSPHLPGRNAPHHSVGQVLWEGDFQVGDAGCGLALGWTRKEY